MTLRQAHHAFHHLPSLRLGTQGACRRHGRYSHAEQHPPVVALGSCDDAHVHRLVLACAIGRVHHGFDLLLWVDQKIVRGAAVHQQEHRQVGPCPDERDEHLHPPLLECSTVWPRVGLGEVFDRGRPFAEAARVLGLANDRDRDLASPGRVGAHVG